MSIPIRIPVWEVGLAGRHSWLDLKFGLVVPLSTVVGPMSTGRDWGRVYVIGSRIYRFRRILTEREWLLGGNWNERRDGGRTVSGLVP